MDSMRSLNTSLPTSSPKGHRRDPPEQLLQAFRSAALSVTTLYKTAAADQERSHQAGYQEALDDLLAFLDHENLGLDDGEGWKVRQWATERLDGAQTSVESDDEKVESEVRARSSSPLTGPKSNGVDTHLSRRPARSASPVRLQTATASTLPSRPQPAGVPVSDAFTFRSLPVYPTQRDTEMTVGDQGISSPAASPRITQTAIPSASSIASPLKVDAANRPSRHRRGVSGSRMTTRSSTSLGVLGSGAGQKRRLPFGEFFDIGFGGGGKDGPSSGGKRGRFS